MSNETNNGSHGNLLNFRKLRGMKSLVATISLVIYSTSICAQSISNIDTTANPIPPVIKPAGTQYLASGWKTLWWGKHYRKEWAVPVSFPVLMLSAIDGGLTPQKEGGG